MLYRLSKIPVDRASFTVRAKRIEYLRKHFSHYIKESVLDVGCDKRTLKSLLPDNVRYVGVDIGGTPDMLVDLDRVDRLPFQGGEFHAVVCLDVLEHLERLHFIFSELERVSSRYIIISLPNNWANARRPIESGKGSIGHYGLPLDPPADRHRWFFSLTEALDFLYGKAAADGLDVVETRITEKPRLPVIRTALRLSADSREGYLNRYAHTVWVALRKRD